MFDERLFEERMAKVIAGMENSTNSTNCNLFNFKASGTKFPVILADPPWPFNESPKSNPRHVSRHYDLMDLEAIMALPVKDIAADDAVLFLWGTWLRNEDCYKVIRAWGFDRARSGFVWVKLNKDGSIFKGQGRDTRKNSEFCLLAKRGRALFVKDRSVSEIIMAPRREHSRKPDEVYNRIERLYDGPYIELFARNEERPGWTKWGNEVGKFKDEKPKIMKSTGKRKSIIPKGKTIMDMALQFANDPEGLRKFNAELMKERGMEEFYTKTTSRVPIEGD